MVNLGGQKTFRRIAMMTRSAVIVQDIQPFTKEQCDKLLLHFKDTSDFEGCRLGGTLV